MCPVFAEIHSLLGIFSGLIITTPWKKWYCPHYKVRKTEHRIPRSKAISKAHTLFYLKLLLPNPFIPFVTLPFGRYIVLPRWWLKRFFFLSHIINELG